MAGIPYFEITGIGELAPGDTTPPLVIAIQTPPRVNYTFTAKLFASVSNTPSDGLLLLNSSPSVSPEFQNPANRFDVNEDGQVSARDTLNILNHLGSGTDLVAADLASMETGTPPP